MNANDILFYIVLIAFTIMITILTYSINEHITSNHKQSKEK